MAMNYDWAFLPMEISNDLLDDTAGLRARFEEDGYLYFSQVIDPSRIQQLRRRMLQVLDECGWLAPGSVLMRGAAGVEPRREGDPEFLRVYDELQKLEEFHTLAHDDRLLAIMRTVLGPTAFPHPLKIARIGFPGHFEVSTPPHQDYPNNQGTEKLTASWIPVGDIPSELGGLAILRGSHRWGVLPLTTHLGPGNRCAVLPPDMLESCRWVSTDFRSGDVLLFPSQTVHAARHNMSDFFFRLSVDFRYQQEGEALTEGCLRPHFDRLTWEQVYSGWRSDRFQYYWEDLRYEVVPFEEYELVHVHSPTEELSVLLNYEQRRRSRYEGARGAEDGSS